MANDITNKMYGTGEGVVQQVVGYVPIPAKITSIGANDPDPLVDAFNIDWASGQYSYDGNPEHIIQSTGHLIEVINSKATASGEAWDNIKGSNYITSQLTIYATNNVKTPPECEFSGEPIDIDNYDKQVYESLPEGWVESLDNVESNYYVFQTSVYEVRTLNNEIKGYHEPIGDVIYLIGENGINGNFKSTVFCRTNETPVAPKQGAYYNTGLPSDTNVYNNSDYNNDHKISNAEWSDGIPNGQEILWASTAIISDNNGSIDDTATWTTPRQMTDTATYDVEFSPNDTKPAVPSNNKTQREAQGWYDPNTSTQVNWEDMIWRAERECINGEWRNWIIVRIKGEQGTAGIKGDFKSTVFKRSENNPGIPNDPNCDYDHPVPSDWYDGIPNGTGPVWSSWRTFSMDGNNSSWTTPQLIADTPTYDVEFSPNKAKPSDPSTTPEVWVDPTTNHYKDYTGENNHVYSGSWEDMIWRAERNRATTQDAWSAWVITKIKGEDGTIGLNSPYFEQRWGVFDKTVTPDAPGNDVITLNTDHDTWNLTPQYTSGKNTWMTARKVVYTINNNEQSAQYDEDSTWSKPMRMSGVDGVSQPIQPVLKYQWTSSNTNAPQLDQDGNAGNAGNAWKESPGNPTSPNIYLWMIQGQRQNGSMIAWDANSDENVGANEYWTTPVCLSGPDGQPGKDGDDLEFIYHVYDEVPTFGNDNDNPAYWDANNADKYLGPENNEWNDNPTGVTITDKYEYCSYRRKTGNPKVWTKFSTPFPWSIYGENGIDGDGVEYIYAVTSTDAAPTQPEINSDNYTASQQSEWGVDENINGVIWHDDPQQLDNVNQKFQWVSVRKYRYPKSDETLGGNELDPNKKYWFNYSRPQLWNWYVNDGTNAPRIMMAYKRTSSNNISSLYSNGTILYPNNGYIWISGNHSYDNNWCENPGNNTQDSGDEFLWMIQAYYTNVENNARANGGTFNKYTLEGSWSTPVCLTGESGHDGEDGSDIEFIYYRTADDNVVPTLPTVNNKYQQNDWPFIGEKDTDYYEINGIKTLSNQDYDTWTDNPLGVTSTYDYEYAAVRRKPAGSNSEWGEFSPVFLWSKYGEDGVDGDGIEYIFYRSSDENEVTFNSENNNLPPTFDLNSNSFQKPEVLGNNNWTDDPQGVNETNVWEYVSVRKFRKITDSNKKEISSSFTSDSYTINDITVHVGDKIWFPYSEPALWSKYAFDAVASNLTIETDNDMMAIAIDGQNTTRNASSNSAQVFLYHNLLLLSSDKYNVSIVSSNCDQSWLTIANTDNKWKITIDIPEDTLLPADGSFNFTIKAKVKNDNTSIPEEIRDAERFYTFKVIGLSLSTIYQLKTDKIVIHRDINNTLENVNATMFNISDINDTFTTGDTLPENFYIFAKPIYVPKGNAIEEIIYDDRTYGNKLFSKNNNSFNIKLYTSSDNVLSILTSVEFNLVYTSDATDKQRIIDSFTSSGNGGSTPAVQPHTSGTLITNGVIVDREIVSVISDGAKGNPGTDSKSQEYIYFVTDDISYFEGGNHADINPNNWDTHENVTINGVSYYAYLTDDFPFVNEQTTYLGWEDTHIGISEEHPYQFMSTREYNTTTKEWGKFSSPECSHNWGHSGEDGDGVEYIYYLNNSATFDIGGTNCAKNPTLWYGDDQFQISEYISNNESSQGWKDNPQSVSENNKYEWVSIRKYKTPNYKDFIELAKASYYGDYYMSLPFTNNELSQITSDARLYSLFTTISGKLNNIIGSSPNTEYVDILLEYFNKLMRHYDEVNEKISNIKEWSPYSRPTLWAKYGERGATGSPGGSGLTFDFDNPSIQIAVNSNGRIKDNQEVTTYLNVYEGASKIPANNITLSIISNGTHAAFEHSYSDTDAYGYTLFNSNSSDGTTYYNWKICDVDIENIGDNNIVKLTENSSIEFNINYNDKDYVKHVSLVPIQYGEDGADAVVFDLYCPTSVIHYNAMDDTPTFNPNTISDIKVRKIENSNVEYKITEGNNGNNNGFAISYYMEFPLSTSQATGGNEGTIGGGEIRPMSLPQKLTKNISGYIYNETLDINDKINTALNDTSNYDIPKTVKLSLYHTENDTSSLWDETDLEIIYDGINGTDSFAEEFIYSITYVPNDNSGGEDPSTWAIMDSRDYIPNNQTSYWKDHPQGISLEHPIEWMSHRTYDYVNKTWNKYEAPVEWSHYGEKGLDGDGIEYIFAVGNNSDWKTAIGYDNDNIARDPRIWWDYTENSDYQKNSEFINSTVDNIWKDNPQTNLQDGQYQFVSIRKYRIFTEHDKNAIKYHNGILGDYDTNSAPYDIDDDTLNSLIGKKMWMPYSEPTIWSSNIPGQPGQDGADAYVLDWTNDQINLAVDENGIILPNQNKSTTLTLLTNDSTLDIDNVAHNFGNIFNAGRSFRSGTTTSSKNYSFSIQIADDYVYDAESASKNVLPENGKEIEFTITLSDGTILYKSLRICGQHNGQNAVTYEIVPSTNAVNYTAQGSNVVISYVVNKYDGNTITQLSNEDFNKSPLYLNASWTPSTGPISYSNIFNTIYYLSGGGSIDLKLWKGQQNSPDAVLLDTETIPVLKNGEKGAQGFTGAVVRMRGEWASNAYYGNGNYNKSNTEPQYDGTSTLYKDIVIYNNKYWTPKNTLTTYLSANNTNSGLCKGSAYVYGTIPSTAVSSKWTEATQYDFIATKLLYADQALINQISSHDFIATTEDGTPVAGMTSGKKEYGKNNERLTLLNNANGGDIDTGGLTGTSSDTLTDTSHVRMFAGQIWKQNGSTTSYSLTYAPFNVRQDGTAYMSKANIVGDVNIGGQVNIGGNVNIEGNAKVKADVNVNTLTLNSGSFIINSDCTLPTFKEYEHKIFYILIHHNEPNTKYYISPNTNQKLLAVQNNGFTEFSTGIEAQNQGLYTAISTYIAPNFYWIISKTGIYSVPTGVQIKTQIYRNDITDYITFQGVEVAANKTLKVKFKQHNMPECSDTSYNNIQSVTLYCNINNSLSYQVAVQTGGVAPWIYNSTKPSDVLSIDGTSDNLDHHYYSGSTTVNGWNANNTDMNIDLWWIDPRDNKEAGDIYRIIKYNDTHGWSIDNSHNTSDAITNSSPSSMFNYYISVTFYK